MVSANGSSRCDPMAGAGDKDTVFYEKVSVTQRPVQIYLVLLKTCMRNPGVTIFGAVILLFFCLVLSISLNIQERKEVESDRFSIYVTMPTGARWRMPTRSSMSSRNALPVFRRNKT